MRTARSPTVHAAVASHQMSFLMGRDPVNKFEQVSSLGHQISPAGGGQG